MRALKAALPLAALLACGCAAPGAPSGGPVPGEAPSGPSAAVAHEKRLFKLSKTPSPGIEAGLQDAVDAAFAGAVKKHSGEKPMDIGFTYTMAPKGAIFPFSEVEVACVIQEKHRGKAARLCRDFFEGLDAGLKNLAQPEP